MNLQDIIKSVSGVVKEVESINTNVKAIALPSVITTPGLPAEVQAGSPGSPATGTAKTTSKWVWYVAGGVVALVVIYLVLKRK